MQNITENCSVVINSDSFDLNGKIGTVRSVDQAKNRCVVITEDGNVYHISLNDVELRTFLSESK